MRASLLPILLLVMTATCAFAQSSAGSDLIVVGNDVGKDRLTQKELRDHFNARYNFWKNGKPVVVVLPAPKSPSAPKISEAMYERSVTGMQKFWLSVVFQGRANPPVFTESDAETVDYVRKTPGAIGLITSDVPGHRELRIAID